MGSDKVTLNVLDKSGKKVEQMEVDKKMRLPEINDSLLHQVVVMNLANKRAGTASTKTRKDVRGGGKKPWKQKGTGRARAGSIRSPLWKGGGVVFGPHPRDFSYSLPKKMKKIALIHALALKINEENLIVLNELDAEKTKTKDVAEMLKKLKSGKEKNLLVAGVMPDSFKKAARNIANLELLTSGDLNAYDVLRCTKLILTKEAFVQINKRVKL